MAFGTSKVLASTTGEILMKTFVFNAVQMVMCLFPETTLVKVNRELLCGDHQMVYGTSRVKVLTTGESLLETCKSSAEREVINLLHSTNQESNLG